MKILGCRRSVSVVLLLVLSLAIGMFCHYVCTVQVPKTVINAVERGLGDVVEDVMPTIVHILYESDKVDYYNQPICWQGSGVIIDKSGLILTARHVCKEPGKFIVTLHDGRKFITKKACVSRKYDVGYLKITDANDFPAAKFGDSDEMRLGSRLLAIGSPWGKEHFNSVTLGILSAVKRSYAERPDFGWEVLFQTDVAANPGNSGGPVFNVSGEVVGIVVGLYAPAPTSYAGITYCIPSNICESFAKCALLTFALQEVIPVESNERMDALENWSKMIEDDIYDIEEWLQDLEEGIKEIDFEIHRPFDDGMEHFEN